MTYRFLLLPALLVLPAVSFAQSDMPTSPPFQVKPVPAAHPTVQSDAQGDEYNPPRTGTPGNKPGDFVPASTPLDEQQDGIKFITGGVGEEELSDMKTQGGDYSLHILSARKDGAFIGDYTIRVFDAKGENKVLEAQGKGPLFYAKLAPGKYQVEEEHNGTVEKRRSVMIGTSGHKDVDFTWEFNPAASPAR